MKKPFKTEESLKNGIYSFKIEDTTIVKFKINDIFNIIRYDMYDLFIKLKLYDKNIYSYLSSCVCNHSIKIFKYILPKIKDANQFNNISNLIISYDDLEMFKMVYKDKRFIKDKYEIIRHPKLFNLYLNLTDINLTRKNMFEYAISNLDIKIFSKYCNHIDFNAKSIFKKFKISKLDYILKYDTGNKKYNKMKIFFNRYLEKNEISESQYKNISNYPNLKKVVDEQLRNSKIKSLL